MPEVADNDAEALLARGRRAVEVGEWTAARQAFEAALEQQESAEALMGLGNALWWLEETQASVRALERAYAAFRRREDPAQAVLAAVSLCLTYQASLGNRAASGGWLARAARLVESFGLADLEGWVLLCRAVLAEDDGDAGAAERWAREAQASARESVDLDLELCALSVLGSALVASGRVAEGAALLDEAMAGSLGGEIEALETVVLTSCQTMICCSRVGDVVRARQWLRVADDFHRRYGSPHLYAVCRTHYGALLFASGRWEDAEAELLAALKIAEGAEPAVRGDALAKLAELRLAQGRVEEAERLLDGLEGRPSAVYAGAALAMARGAPAVAIWMIERRLGKVGWECLEAAALAEPLVEAWIELHTVPGDAAGRIRRLAEIGAAGGGELMEARAERALARLSTGAEDGRVVAPQLERALAGFERLEMPLEIDRTRLLLARAIAGESREVATVEAQRALSGFQALGAHRDADAAASFLRSLGVSAARTGPRGLGLLTAREREVLELLGEGMSNPEIARRLVVSRKTVEHHVARVLSKLGLRGRGEAAAYVVRDLGPSRDAP